MRGDHGFVLFYRLILLSQCFSLHSAIQFFLPRALAFIVFCIILSLLTVAMSVPVLDLIHLDEKFLFSDH